MVPSAARVVAASFPVVVMLRADQRFSVPGHVLSRSVGDDTVLLDLHQDEYFSLGRVGTQVWAQIAQGAVLGSIVAKIAEGYGVERDRVEADVLALVEDLVTSGLLVEA